MRDLTSIIKYAYSMSPIYSEILGKDKEIDANDIKSLPIISKDIILNERTPILSVEYMIQAMDEKLIKMFTSGSTGKYMEIQWDKKDYNESLLPLWIYRKKYYGIRPNDRRCFFYTIRKTGSEELEFDEREHSIGFSKCALDEEKIIGIYNKMLEYDPVWMLLQPGIALLLIQAAEDNKLPKLNSLRYIEFSGEMLFDSDRKRIEDFFGCSISNQYGAYEVNSIAYECNKGHLHCLSNNVYVEIVKDDIPIQDGEEGDIVITSLHNYAMPFVRYNIGDRGILCREHQCACGNKSPILKLTSGRSNDWILNKDGTKVNAYVFARAVENVNYALDNVIKQFQFIQNDYDDFTVKLAIDDEDEIDDIVEILLENILQPSLNGAEYEFEFSKVLFPENNNGKLLYFKNMMIAT